MKCNGNESHLQKEPGPKVLSFSWKLALRTQIHTRNDTHYEIIGVDKERRDGVPVQCRP